MTRRPLFDPRTVAREIPGLFDSVFPQLTPGVVSAFNRHAEWGLCEPIPPEDIAACQLQHALLFELGFAAGELLITSQPLDWNLCVERAIGRQRRHYDAQIPDAIPEHDREIALFAGNNLAKMLAQVGEARRSSVVAAPPVPGFQWISSGHGDFAVGDALIEIKFSARNFSAADYRQLTMYWLLSYASALESGRQQWGEGILMNPRYGQYIAFDFDEFLRTISAGRTKVEIFTQFAAVVGTRSGI